MIALKVRAPCRLADASDGPRRGSSCPRRRFGTNVCPVATVRTEATRFSPLIGRRLALSRPWCDPRRSWQTGRCDRRHGRQHRRHAGTARRLHGEPSTPHRPGPISTPTRARHPSRAGAARHRLPPNAITSTRRSSRSSPSSATARREISAACYQPSHTTGICKGGDEPRSRRPCRIRWRRRASPFRLGRRRRQAG